MRWYDLPDLLPPVYAGIDSMFAVADTENTELKAAYAIRNAILDNFFIQTCDLKTLQYWEQLLGIEIDEGETVDERRAMILIYLVANWQITDSYITEIGIGYFGEGKFAIEYDAENHLKINLRMVHPDVVAINRFMRWFITVCPAHIDWFAGPVFPSEETVVSIARGIGAYIAVCQASMTAGTATLYLGPTSQTIDTVEV